MKKRKLYDFSAAYLAVFVICYSLLFAASLYNLFFTSHKLGSAIAFSIFFASFAFLAARFGIMAAYTDGESVTYGKLRIKREDAQFLSKYDYRFKESVIVIRDKNTDYRFLEPKEAAKKAIKVQATPRNCAILGDFFGKEIVPVKKPKQKKQKKEKKS